MSQSINQRRPRRDGEEVRSLMLAAARELFATKGFEATTREIANKATVTEQLLFNHFGSKRQLFAMAVVRPFEQFVEAQLAEWQLAAAAGLDAPDMMHEYVAGLYKLAVEHRAVFLALSSNPFGTHAWPVLDRLEAATAEIAARHGYTFDAHIAVRIVFAAVTTMSLHRDSLDDGRSAEDVVDELSATFAAGLSRRGRRR